MDTLRNSNVQDTFYCCRFVLQGCGSTISRGLEKNHTKIFSCGRFDNLKLLTLVLEMLSSSGSDLIIASG